MKFTPGEKLPKPKVSIKDWIPVPVPAYGTKYQTIAAGA